MGFSRKQFTFYRSYIDAAASLTVKQRGEYLVALIQYALDEIEPVGISPAARTAFEIVRPFLDVARRKAQAGKTGGEASGEARSKNEANRSKPKQTEANTKQVKEQVKEQVKGKGEGEEDASPSGNSKESFSDVFDTLMITGVFMSDKDKLDCEELCAEYGSRAVVQAIQRAKEQDAPRWPYIRAIITSGGVSSAGAKRPGYLRHDGSVSPAMADWIRRSYEDDGAQCAPLQKEDQNDNEGGAEDAKES